MLVMCLLFLRNYDFCHTKAQRASKYSSGNRQLSEAISSQAITNCPVFRAELQIRLNGDRMPSGITRRLVEESGTFPVRE
jgi:hypothetical protein